MRAVVRRFDRLLRWALGVFEFSDQDHCLLRLQWAQAAHRLQFSDGTVVQPGEPMLFLHLWNEHLPPTGPAWPDLTWAVKVQRMLMRSMQWAARWLADRGDLERVRAVGSVTVLILLDDGPGQRLAERLGFEVFPYRNPLGRFGEFWENLYTWALMWAYNPASLRGRSLFRLRRAEMWMPVEAFTRRYGGTG